MITLLFFLFSCSSKDEDSAVDPCELDSDDDGLTNCQEEDHHTDPNKADTDGDGVEDWDEINTLKTDPTKPDTDGDGYSDGDEYNNLGTSPTNEYSHPYKGDYNVGACAEYPDKATAHPSGSRTVETGGGGGTVVALYQPGDTVQNFQMVDQYGERVDLYSFCGKYVDLFFFQFNELSGPPEYAALSCWIQDMKNVHSYYRDYGYELIVVLTQNNETQLPTQADVAAVAAMLGFNNNPVLASNDETMGSVHSWFEKDFHEPTLVHIGPDLQVLSVDNDNCPGGDRDPCPYMKSIVPEELCWDNPDPTCEPLDYSGQYLYCACPATACEAYCGEGNCPVTWED